MHGCAPQLNYLRIALDALHMMMFPTSSRVVHQRVAARPDAAQRYAGGRGLGGAIPLGWRWGTVDVRLGDPNIQGNLGHHTIGGDRWTEALPHIVCFFMNLVGLRNCKLFCLDDPVVNNIPSAYFDRTT